jgi:thermostable 8-oxoguanine DNA glycosylase
MDHRVTICANDHEIIDRHFLSLLPNLRERYLVMNMCITIAKRAELLLEIETAARHFASEVSLAPDCLCDLGLSQLAFSVSMVNEHFLQLSTH